MYIQSVAIKNQFPITREIVNLGLKRIRSIFLLLFFISLVTVPTGDTIKQRDSFTLAVETALPVVKAPIEIIYPTPPTWIPNEFILFVIRECDKSGVPYLLVFKLIENESGWLQKAKNFNIDPDTKKIVSIDYGRMQINSLNFKDFIAKYKDSNRKASSYDLINNAYDNTQIGIRHLADLYHQLNSWTMAVTAYNAGIVNTLRGTLTERTKSHVNRIIPVENWWTFPDTVKIIRK